MSHDPLEGVKAKLARADEHMKALDEEWQAFGKTQSYEGYHQFKADTGEWNCYLSLSKPIPIKLSMILGDALNNMRSSLDHLVCRFVELHNGKVGKHHAFPICSDAASYDERVNQIRRKKDRSGPLDGIPADGPERALIEKVQPYHQGKDWREHPLWILNRMTNIDKHRDIHIAASYPQAASALDLLTWTPDDAELIDQTLIWQPGQPLEDRTHIARLRFREAHPADEVNVKVSLPLSLAFGDPEPGPHKDSVAELLAYVAEIVRRAEMLFLQGRPIAGFAGTLGVISSKPASAEPGTQS
jgi:hypothetical protein